jgi:HPt (histidine-containing phosphotransfer) domain-containing protein
VGTAARAGRDRRQCRLVGEAAQLFLEESAGQCTQLQQAQAAATPWPSRRLLHKLRAGCGFVGAARLAHAVDVLSDRRSTTGALREFAFAAEDTLAAGDQR